MIKKIYIYHKLFFLIILIILSGCKVLQVNRKKVEPARYAYAIYLEQPIYQGISKYFISKINLTTKKIEDRIPAKYPYQQITQDKNGILYLSREPGIFDKTTIDILKFEERKIKKFLKTVDTEASLVIPYRGSLIILEAGRFLNDLTYFRKYSKKGKLIDEKLLDNDLTSALYSDSVVLKEGRVIAVKTLDHFKDNIMLERSIFFEINLNTFDITRKLDLNQHLFEGVYGIDINFKKNELYLGPLTLWQSNKKERKINLYYIYTFNLENLNLIHKTKIRGVPVNLVVLENHHLLVVNEHKGLTIIDTNTQAIIQTWSHNIERIMKVSDSNVLISSSTGLYLFNGQTRSTIKLDTGDYGPISRNFY